MLHDDFREARIAAGLSQSELARRAGVPRRQIQLVENGANVTIETLRRIIPALPNLQRITLGGIEVATTNADLEEARRAALDLFDVAKRLMAALGAASPAPSQSIKVYPASGSETERRHVERLEKMVREGKHKRRRSDS